MPGSLPPFFQERAHEANGNDDYSTSNRASDCRPSLGALIDFSTIVEYSGDGLILRIDDATFSHDLYTHTDGFDDYLGGTYNFYGEQAEFITFDGMVTVNSMKLMDMASLNATNPLYVEFFDASDQSLGMSTLDLTANLTTYDFNVAMVKKMVFTFGGGIPFYNDGREHAWYFIDDISYNDGTPVEHSSWGEVKALY